MSDMNQSSGSCTESVESNSDPHRCFGGLEDHLQEKIKEPSLSSSSVVNSQAYIEALNNDIIGNYEVFEGPFGKRPMIYADWTASGRAVGNIEEFVRHKVLPYYGNTVSCEEIPY